MSDSTGGQEDSSEQEVIFEVACNVADTLEQAVELGEEDLLRVALATLDRAGVKESVEVSLLVTDDLGLRELNRDFRGRDEATDVLSFPLLDAPIVEAPADELWQSADESDGADSSSRQGQGSWLGSDDHGTAGLSDAEDALDGDVGEEGEDDEDDGDFDDGPLHLGDIAISRDAVARQAATAGHSVAWECAFLFSHGLLHLLGYDDTTDAGYRAMVAHQEAALDEARIIR
jgi:probable rRNA maturation factor